MLIGNGIPPSKKFNLLERFVEQSGVIETN